MPDVKWTSTSSVVRFDAESSSSTNPSQSLSMPSQISTPGGFIVPMQRWLPAMLLSQTQLPVPAQGPLPKMQDLPIWNGSSVWPLQSLSSVSQPNLVSSIASYVAG